MNLTKEESTILRRLLSAVNSLFSKGLLTFTDSKIHLTEAALDWIAQDDERIRLAKSRGGLKGGPARAHTLTRKQLARIGRKGGKAKAAAAKKSIT